MFGCIRNLLARLVHRPTREMAVAERVMRERRSLLALLARSGKRP